MNKYMGAWFAKKCGTGGGGHVLFAKLIHIFPPAGN